MTFALQPLQVLDEQGVDAGASAVTTYFRNYAGRLFDWIANESPRDQFNAADLYAIGTLSAEIEPVAGLALLFDAELRKQVGAGVLRPVARPHSGMGRLGHQVGEGKPERPPGPVR